MFDARITLIATAIGLGLPAIASAQSNTDLEQIRNEIRDLKQSYEARIEALEKRLKEAEDSAAKAQAAASQAQSTAAQAQQSAQAASVPAAPAPQSGGGGGNAFNPAISLILDGTYRNYSQNPHTRSVTGFLPQGSLGLLDHGFNLDESEITMWANVDHVFARLGFRRSLSGPERLPGTQPGDGCRAGELDRAPAGVCRAGGRGR